MTWFHPPGATFRVPVRLPLDVVAAVLGVLLITLGVAGPAAAATPVPSEDVTQGEGAMLLVLDASGSMKEPSGDGRTRFAAAQAAMREVIGKLPPDVAVGLRVYGAEVSDGPGSCEDSEVVVPVGSQNRRDLLSAVAEARPLGNTPIAHSLRASLDDLPAEGERSIVLISDGEESCGGDPCAVAREISQDGAALHVDVVGFQVDQAARDQLTCIAQAGRGTFYDAPDAGALASQLERLSARAARAYAPAGTPIEGTDTAAGAPTVESGLYLDTIGDASDTETYAVAPADGSTLHVAATVRPTVAAAADGEALELSVLSGSTTCATFRSTSLGAFDRLTPVTASGLVAGDELAECGAGPYAVQVVRGSGAGVKPLEVVVVEEPAVESVGGLPAPEEEGAYDARATGSGRPGTAVGSPSFTGAAVLPPGRYRDSILVGETLLYAVELDWGQQLVCDVDLAASPRVDAALGTSAPTAEIRLYGPTRGQLTDLGLDSSARDFYDAASRVTLHRSAPPVRYRNREAGGHAAGAAIPGTYYCGVLLNGRSDLASAGEAPLAVTLDVLGSAGEGAPAYVEPADAPPVPEDSAGGGETAGGDAAEGEDAGGVAGWWWGLGGVLLAAAAAVAVRRVHRS